MLCSNLFGLVRCCLTMDLYGPPPTSGLQAFFWRSSEVGLIAVRSNHMFGVHNPLSSIYALSVC
jgi:hypothetical protein